MIKNPVIEPVTRKVTNRGPRRVISFFPSLINKKLVVCESKLEADLLFIVELDRSVQSYRSQPHKLVYYDENIKRSYTPDFLVHRSGHETVVEVKPQDKLSKWQKKMNEVEIAYGILGYPFVLLTEKAIRRQPRLSNAKYLFRHSRHQVSRTSFKHLVDHFKSNRGCSHTIGSVRDLLASKDVREVDIFKLIFCGTIRFDPEMPLTSQSAIWLSKDLNA